MIVIARKFLEFVECMGKSAEIRLIYLIFMLKQFDFRCVLNCADLIFETRFLLFLLVFSERSSRVCAHRRRRARRARRTRPRRRCSGARRRRARRRGSRPGPRGRPDPSEYKRAKRSGYEI